MDHQIYAMHDKQLKVFQMPVFLKSPIVAIRSLEMSARDQNLQIVQYPDKFDLVQIGEYDESSGKIVGFEKPRLIITMVAVMRNLKEMSKKEEVQK